MADRNVYDRTSERERDSTCIHPEELKKVTLIADEWLSGKGGLSTINRELSIQLAKFPNLKVGLFMRKCTENEKKLAGDHSIDIIESQNPDADEWWISPENFSTDIVIGHSVKLGKQAEDIKKAFQCKWVQVVHTEPEELSSVKEYEGAGAKGEEKSEEEIRLCRMADMVVGIGPKLKEAYDAKLRPDHTVFELTPGIFKEFAKVKQAPNEGNKFRVLIFGRGDPEDISLKGYDLAAQSVAQLHQNDKSVYLVFTGVKNNEHGQVREILKNHGVLDTRLVIRAFSESREILAKTFQEVDLAIMPSRTEGFGLAALEALSAGLPVLVGWNTGFAEALKKLPNGNHCVVDSDHANDWAKAIKKVQCKERKIRLEESKRLREDYEEAYPWPKRCEALMNKMLNLDKHDLEDDEESEMRQKTFPNRTRASSKRHQGLGEEETRKEILSKPTPPKRQQVDDRDIEVATGSFYTSQQQTIAVAHPSTSQASAIVTNPPEYSQLPFKDGMPDDGELQELAFQIGPKWFRVGLNLGLKQPVLDDIDVNEKDKPFRMLLQWKRTTTSELPYKQLYGTLCHESVGLNNLAKEFCLKKPR